MFKIRKSMNTFVCDCIFSTHMYNMHFRHPTYTPPTNTHPCWMAIKQFDWLTAAVDGALRPVFLIRATMYSCWLFLGICKPIHFLKAYGSEIRKTNVSKFSYAVIVAILDFKMATPKKHKIWYLLVIEIKSRCKYSIPMFSGSGNPILTLLEW